jgi:hypothetical protein
LTLGGGARGEQCEADEESEEIKLKSGVKGECTMWSMLKFITTTGVVIWEQPASKAELRNGS